MWIIWRIFARLVFDKRWLRIPAVEVKAPGNLVVNVFTEKGSCLSGRRASTSMVNYRYWDVLWEMRDFEVDNSIFPIKHKDSPSGPQLSNN